MVKKIAWRLPQSKRKQGRPRKWWREAVMENLKEKGINDWKAKSKDRKALQRITKL